MSSRVIARKGGGLTVTIRRRSTLRNAQAGAFVTTLTAAAALAGAAIVTLSATGLKGKLVSGSTLTFAGSATVHTTTADVEANASGQLVNVPITPARAGALVAGTVAILVSTNTETPVPAFVPLQSESKEDGGGTQRVERAFRYHLDAAVLAHVEPGDTVTGADGVEKVIDKARAVGSPATRWVIEGGEA